jgi:hypothetical protein
MTHIYQFKPKERTPQPAGWQVAEVLGGSRPDFSRPFLPESFARTRALHFLDGEERRVLNQIRGRGYVHVLGLIDAFILPFVLGHGRRLLDSDGSVRSVLQVAAEEAKHIQLFERFRTLFDRGFGSPCEGIDATDDIRRTVLAADPLAGALVVLMAEGMIQSHYGDAVESDMSIDPLFKSLLRHHAMEEAGHVRFHLHVVGALARAMDAAAIDVAIDDFFAIAARLDAALAEQVVLDLAAFERATGRALTGSEREAFRRIQHQAQRWTFLWSGMRHPSFVATLDRLGEAVRNRITEAAPAFG